MDQKNQGIAIVGPGRLGRALGKLLSDKGFRVLLVAARRLGRARAASRFIGAGRPVLLDDPALGEAKTILITVSDTAVESVARELAELRKDWTDKVILHVCGSLPLSVLESFRRRGAAIGSLHPYQTVPSSEIGAKNLVGCYWAVEGDAKARKLALEWLRKLQGKPIHVHPSARPLYHLSAFLVCPTTLVLMAQSEKLLRKAGVHPSVIRSMLRDFVIETAKNFARLGPRKAITGPASRGDWMTIRKHIAELRRASPGALPSYRELTRLIAIAAGKTIPAGVLTPSGKKQSAGQGKPR